MSGNPGQSHVAQTIDVGPMLVLISPASYIGTIAVMTSIGYLFMITSKVFETWLAQLIGLLWCYTSIGTGLWSLYLLYGGYRENIRLRNPVYGSIGFFWAAMIILVEIVITSFTIVGVAQIKVQ
jgi:hypothetical protein